MKKTKPIAKLISRRIFAAACGAALLAGVQSVTAQSIGCNITTNSSGGIDLNSGGANALLPTDMAGVPSIPGTQSSSYQGYWNNLSRYGSGTLVLTNSLGTPYTFNMQWDCPSSDSTGTAAGLGTADGKLMDGFGYSWGPGAATALGNSVYGSSTADKPLVFISGLQAWITNVPNAECYGVVLYTTGYTYYETGEGYVESVSGSPLNNTMVEGSSLVPHLFAHYTSHYAGTYIPVTSTSSGSPTSGNYMFFSGLTNDAVLLRLQSSGYGSGLNAFQFVPVYPSAPTATAPTISPSSTVYAGIPVTITEVATGDPIHTNLWYQWQSDNGVGGPVTNNILNATNTVYSFTPTNSASQYTLNFQVVITNVFGAVTSSVVALTVNPAIAPYTTTDTSPGQGDGSTNVYAFANGSVTFSAVFAGPVPITNLWQVDKGSGYTGILNATNGSVTVTNLQSTDQGNYRMLAGNVYGQTPSTPAPLTLLADPAAPDPSQAYAYAVFTNNPVAYWRFNETTLNVATNSVQAYDYSGHNLDATYGHGTYPVDNGLDSSSSPSFPGFESVNQSVELQNGTAGSYLTAPSLNLNTNTVTISMWINPNSVVGTYWGLLMWNGTNGDKAGFGFGSNQSNSVAELGYTWNTNSSATYNFHSALYPPTYQWSFVSLVITPTNSTIYLYYTDGSGTHVSKAVQTIANSSEAFSGGTVWIGMDGYTGRTFDGFIDEVSVFNKSLSETQIQNLFRVGSGIAGVAPIITSDISPTNVNTFAGLSLTMTANGDGMPVPAYQWQAGSGGVFANINNGGGVSGANSSTLTIASPAPANNLNYHLVLSNTYGSVTSSICNVTLSPVPTNGLWAACYQVTNNDNGVGYVHASGSYTGQGVLGHGGYWNVIPGAGLYGYSSSNYTSVTDYQDNGSTHSGITCKILGYAQSWVIGQAYPSNNVGGMFGQFVTFNTTNTVTNAIAFTGVPDGTYNLAFHGINGQNASHGTIYNAHGVNGDQSASTLNQQSQFFRNADTTVIITNVVVSGGTLNVDMTSNNTNGAADVNGVEIQLVSYAPLAAAFSGSPTNIFVTQSVTFTDASTGATNWLWNFGDGNTLSTSTKGNVSHAYNTVGTYTVSQTVTGSGGLMNSVTNVSYIVVAPKPAISGVKMSGGSFILSGGGGINGVQYRILTSTNVALPLSSWTTASTSAFAPDGSYSYTNSSPTNNASFFIMVSP
jgi:PKD repeat protein